MGNEMQYLLIVLAAVLLIALVAKLVKGVAKAIALAVIVLAGLLAFGIITKEQVKEAAETGKGMIAGEYKEEDGLTGILEQWFQ